MWRFINVHIHVRVHLFVCQQHKNCGSLGCFGLHIDLVEQNICSSKYVESGNGQRLCGSSAVVLDLLRPDGILH